MKVKDERKKEESCSVHPHPSFLILRLQALARNPSSSSLEQGEHGEQPWQRGQVMEKAPAAARQRSQERSGTNARHSCSAARNATIVQKAAMPGHS